MAKSKGTFRSFSSSVTDTRRDGFDPIGNFHFEVEIEGIACGSFSGVDGLSYEVEMIEYRDSTQPMRPRFRPGQAKLGRVTLKGGYRCKNELMEWIKKAEMGSLQRRSISIWLVDNAGARTNGWNLYACLPAKWNISSLDGKGGDIAIESIELVTEEIMVA